MNSFPLREDIRGNFRKEVDILCNMIFAKEISLLVSKGIHFFRYFDYFCVIIYICILWEEFNEK